MKKTTEYLGKRKRAGAILLGTCLALLSSAPVCAAQITEESVIIGNGVGDVGVESANVPGENPPSQTWNPSPKQTDSNNQMNQADRTGETQNPTERSSDQADTTNHNENQFNQTKPNPEPNSNSKPNPNLKPNPNSKQPNQNKPEAFYTPQSSADKQVQTETAVQNTATEQEPAESVQAWDIDSKQKTELKSGQLQQTKAEEKQSRVKGSRLFLKGYFAFAILLLVVGSYRIVQRKRQQLL